jgi:hypothetical protein
LLRQWRNNLNVGKQFGEFYNSQLAKPKIGNPAGNPRWTFHIKTLQLN